jgi:hypothetical protein
MSERLGAALRFGRFPELSEIQPAGQKNLHLPQPILVRKAVNARELRLVIGPRLLIADEVIH